MMRNVVVALTAMALLAVPVTADEVVGVSGQCYGADGNGGEGNVSVDPDDPASATTEDDIVGAAMAAAQLAQGTAATMSPGSSCTAEYEDDAQHDYVAVRAGGQEVCYAGTLVTDGSCPDSTPGYDS
ncbi:MAG: hypothetical protein ACPGQL_07000 [Thermoplasmatota archaeon]